MNNVTHTPGFIKDAAWIIEELLNELPLVQEHIRMYGRDIPTPRLTSWHGDAGRSYRFSGRTLEPAPWTPILATIRAGVEAETGATFNSVLANYYRDGSDSVAFHADDEPGLGPVIASVSLGDYRRFVVKANDGGERAEWSLGGGDLLVMSGDLQTTHKHSIPKTKKPVGPRLNLTFRTIG